MWTSLFASRRHDDHIDFLRPRYRAVFARQEEFGDAEIYRRRLDAVARLTVAFGDVGRSFALLHGSDAVRSWIPSCPDGRWRHGAVQCAFFNV